MRLTQCQIGARDVEAEAGFQRQTDDQNLQAIESYPNFLTIVTTVQQGIPNCRMAKILHIVDVHNH